MRYRQERKKLLWMMVLLCAVPDRLREKAAVCDSAAAEETVTEGTTAGGGGFGRGRGSVRLGLRLRRGENSRSLRTAGGQPDYRRGGGSRRYDGRRGRTYLNLAETVSDGQKIEVPRWKWHRRLRKPRQRAISGLVNLNRATEAELMTLSGIGESKAKEIIRYRESKGGFQKPEDLMNIPGIKEGVFNKIRDQITA